MPDDNDVLFDIPIRPWHFVLFAGIIASMVGVYLVLYLIMERVP